MEEASQCGGGSSRVVAAAGERRASWAPGALPPAKAPTPASRRPVSPAAGSGVCALNEWGTVSVRRTSPPGKGDRLVAGPRVSPGDLEQGAGIEIGGPQSFRERSQSLRD